jgi:hypothetical protein
MIGQTRLSRLTDETRRDQLQVNRIEIVAVEKILPHIEPLQRTMDGGAIGDLDQIDGNLRDRSMPIGEHAMRWRVNILQRNHGRFAGHPYTPRVGDLAVILWYSNEKGVLLGTIPNVEQETVCRPGCNQKTYDQVWKFTPWDRPSKDGDRNWTAHPLPRNPDCLKWWDEREGGSGRDWIFVKNCKPGNDEPRCKTCTGPDHILRGCSWFKALSENSLASCGKDNRTWHHHLSGSTMFFDDDGVVYIENRVDEVPKGHIKFFPDGKIEIQSRSKESGEVCGCDGDGSPIIEGARITLEPDGEIWINNLEVDGEDSGYIRILPDGEIIVITPRKISIVSEEEDILIKAATKITLDAPLIDEVTSMVHNHGNQRIDGHCYHHTCSC